MKKKHLILLLGTLIILGFGIHTLFNSTPIIKGRIEALSNGEGDRGIGIPNSSTTTFYDKLPMTTGERIVTDVLVGAASYAIGAILEGAILAELGSELLVKVFGFGAMVAEKVTCNLLDFDFHYTWKYYKCCDTGYDTCYPYSDNKNPDACKYTGKGIYSY